MLRNRIVILFLLCALMTIGCFKSQRAGNDNSRIGASNSSPAGNAEKIGIPECDEFVAKYEACIADHVPEAKKREYRENLAAWSRAWRQQMVKTTAKETVAAACKRHIDMTREAMKSYGCEF